MNVLLFGIWLNGIKGDASYNYSLFLLCIILHYPKINLLTTNINREYMYWADKGKIFRILKNSLHESLFLAPIIILIALFCNLNTHLLLVEYCTLCTVLGLY